MGSIAAAVAHVDEAAAEQEAERPSQRLTPHQANQQKIKSDKEALHEEKESTLREHLQEIKVRPVRSPRTWVVWDGWGRPVGELVVGRRGRMRWMPPRGVADPSHASPPEIHPLNACPLPGPLLGRTRSQLSNGKRWA